MENGFSFLKGAHIAENALQKFAGFLGILSHPAGGVGIGAYGDDLAAQLLDPAEVVLGVQKSAAPV